MSRYSFPLILFLALLIQACTPHVGNEQGPGDAQPVGAFSQGDTLTASDLAAYTAATKGNDFFAHWTPRRVSRQVVAGTNYRFYCETGHKADNPEEEEVGTLVVYQPLPGQGITRVTGINGQNNAALVVINKKTNKVLGRYEGETAKEYRASLQDEVRVLKSRARLELRSAATGEGYVWPLNYGSLTIKRSPAGYGTPLGHLTYEEGALPDVLPCTGFTDGHYRVIIDGTYGYIEADSAQWDVLNTF